MDLTFQWNSKTILKLFTPMALGFMSNRICWSKDGGKSAGASVKFRPPPYVFGIVWPILYLMLGLSWILATADKKNKTQSNIVESFYLLIVFLLSFWIYVYGCNKNKVGGVYVITLTIGAIILAMNVVRVESRVLLTPLLTWLLIALLLNVAEVQGGQKK